jgi:excisionase family DNA binding protein
MEAVMELSAARMADLEQRIAALENRTRRVLWSGMDSLSSREDDLVLRFGEYVDKTAAAEILGVTRATIYAMLADGRIESACAGRRVDVRSIARYMNRSGSVRRRGRKTKQEEAAKVQ